MTNSKKRRSHCDLLKKSLADIVQTVKYDDDRVIGIKIKTYLYIIVFMLLLAVLMRHVL